MSDSEIAGWNLAAEVSRLRALLEHNRCNSGHETLPLKLWDCPVCAEERVKEARRAALREAAEVVRTFRECTDHVVQFNLGRGHARTQQVIALTLDHIATRLDALAEEPPRHDSRGQ